MLNLRAQEHQRSAQLTYQSGSKGIAVNVNARFLQVNPALINTFSSTRRGHINTRANNNLRGITCLTGQFNQDPCQVTVE